MPSGIFYFFGAIMGVSLLLGLPGLYYYNKFMSLKIKMEETLQTIKALVDRRQGQLKQVANPLQKDTESDPVQRGIDKTNVEIEGARRYYNALARDYNKLVQSFPSLIYALLLRQQKAEYLESKE